jgi:NDP-hexose 3,5-(Or5-) epimerase
MDIRELAVADAYCLKPDRLTDSRGCFYELFRPDVLAEVTGHRFAVAQTNISVSRRGTLRGIHGASVPPGLAKVVTCLRGTVLDIAVDLRVGSPTFGQHDITWQDAESGISVYLAEGLGHAFLALTDDACMHYMCSDTYDPDVVIDVNPLDPELGVRWGLTSEPVMSKKDAAAPTLAEAAERGLLPAYADCLALYAAKTEPTVGSPV